MRTSLLTPEQRVAKILEEAVGSDLSSWEKYEFLPNIRMQRTLFDRQEKILAKIESRIFGAEEE